MSEALQLALWLDSLQTQKNKSGRRRAAAELRRLHAENERLKRERDDFERRWEDERKAAQATIVGGRYPDGRPAW